jgi:hypothetical protein
MNSWLDAAMTPFRSEKDTNWEGAFRVPAMVRWPDHIKPGSISNEIFSGHDWFPTLLAVAGDTEVKERLLSGWQVGGRTYKVHLDGYNQLPYLTVQQEKSDRKGFVYFDDDGHVVAVRYANWKIVFAEQKTQGTLDIWGEPSPSAGFRRSSIYEWTPMTGPNHLEHLLGLDDPYGIIADGGASDRRAIHRNVPRIPTGAAAAELQYRPDHGEIAAANERLAIGTSAYGRD